MMILQQIGPGRLIIFLAVVSEMNAKIKFFCEKIVFSFQSTKTVSDDQYSL